MHNSKKIALTGMMCALAVVIMMMGGLIPLATFCCPMLAGLMLVPIFVECGEKLTYGAYIAVAALSLMLSPDKESALLFAFLGYYPALRWRIEQLRSGMLRLILKLLIFNIAVITMYALCIFVFRLDQVLADYQEMGKLLLGVCLVLGNFCMLLYDRLLAVMTRIYVNRLRRKIF